LTGKKSEKTLLLGNFYGKKNSTLSSRRFFMLTMLLGKESSNPIIRRNKKNLRSRNPSFGNPAI
jgi:hypothetical protein